MPTTNQYLAIERACLNNASRLHREADTLLNQGSFERAYFLALTGIEELAKLVLCADTRTGARSEDDWRKAFLRHDQKFALIAQIGMGAICNPLEKHLVELYGAPLKPLREACLYVEVDSSGDPITPSQRFDREAALQAVRGVANHLQGVKQALLYPDGPTSRLLNTLAAPEP